MPYVPKRARKGRDISSALRVCSQCLGDLEYRTAGADGHYVCLQCGVRNELAAAARPAAAFYDQDATMIEPNVLSDRVSS
jgi:hypothetical protein